MKKKPLLTISLLVSNRPDTVRRCLDSLRPIREAVSSELILVDTSKNPMIHKILLEYTHQVYEFEWCKDFAKARNVGLQKAQGEWFLFLDDDEWFVEYDELIQFFLSGEYEEYGCACHRIRNFVDTNQTRYNEGWVTRLYRLEKGGAFQGKVHEIYRPIRRKEKYIEALSYHSGYIFESKEKKREHYERNTTLLYEMIVEEPMEMRWKMQLVQEHAIMGEWEKLERFCKECMDKVNSSELECSRELLNCFWSGYVDSIGKQKHYEEAIGVMDTLIKDERLTEMLKWQLYYRYTEDYFCLRDWDEAEKYAKLFIEAAENKENQDKITKIQNEILLLGETFDDERIAQTYMMFVVSGLKKGNVGLLEKHYDRLRWNQLICVSVNGTIDCLVDAMAENEYHPLFGKLVTDAYRNIALRPLMSLAAEKYSKKKDAGYRRILYVYAQAESDDMYIWKAKLQVADWNQDVERIKAELQKGFRMTNAVFEVHKAIGEITEKYGIKLCDYWRKVGTEQWKESVKRFFRKATKEEVTENARQICQTFKEKEWKRTFFEEHLTKPLLTISLLVSNRPDTVRRCLDSLRPIQEAVSSELILVDTSKNPMIHKILLEYTHQVYEFEWCKDFAKARNVGLQKAQGEWFLFLDDDEWFVEYDELIRFFLSGEYKQYGYANYRVRNFFDVAYKNYSDGWVSRLVRVDSDTHFEGRVHEAFAPIRGARKDIGAMVYHSGYIFETEEKKQKHFDRNATLLMDMVREEPQNMRWRMQLMQEYTSVGKWEELVFCCEGAIEVLEERTDERAHLERSSFYAGLVYAYLREAEYGRCIEVSRKALEDKRSVAALCALLCIRMAEAYLKLEDWKEAKHCAERYLEFAERAKMDKRMLVRENSVPFLGEAFGDHRAKDAYSIIISADLKCGKVETLERLYDRLEWNQSDVYASENIECVLLDAMGQLEYRPIFARIISDAYRNRGLMVFMNVALREKEDDDEQMRKILYAYAQAEGEDGRIWYAKAYMAGLEGDTDRFRNALEKYFANAGNVLDLPKRLIAMAEKHGMEIYNYWKETKPDCWKHSVVSEVDYLDGTQVCALLEIVRQVLGESSWKYRFMRCEVLHKQGEIEAWVQDVYELYEEYIRKDWSEDSVGFYELHEKMSAAESRIEGPDSNEETIEEDFREFMLAELAFYQAMYTKRAFEGEMEMLSPQARCAVYLEQFFEQREATDTEGQVALLRKCLREYPVISEKIKGLLKTVTRQKEASEHKNVQNANEQLAQMIEAMKGKILQMAENGQRQEALAVLKQVRTFAPQDKQLAEMEVQLSTEA